MAAPDSGNLWAEYRKNIGITQSGGFASQWDDQSGNTRHIAQATGAKQPAANGEGSLLFDGVSHWMGVTSALSHPVTVYFRGKQITWSAGDTFYDGQNIETVRFGQANAPGVSPDVEQTIGTPGNRNSGWALNTLAIVTAIFDAGDYLTQVDANAPVTGYEPTAPGAAGGFILGRFGTYDESWSGLCNMEVHDVLVYNAVHDAAMRQAVRDYINGRVSLSRLERNRARGLVRGMHR